MKESTFYIYEEIGSEGVTASNFAKQLEESKPDTLNVRINSIGGSVIEGFGIFSLMMEFKKKGGVLNTFNDGLAASTAGWLLLAAEPDNIYAKDYSLLVIHGVKNDTAGNLFQNGILKIFKGRSGVDMQSLMTNGIDNFFTSEQSASMGLMPSKNIQNTGLRFDMPENFSLVEVANKLKNIDNELNNNLEMKKVINLLNLQEGASEDIVFNAVQNAINSSETFKDELQKTKNSLSEKENEISRLKSSLEALNKTTAEALVDTAIKEGKFNPKSEDEKQKIVSNALNDIEAFKTMTSLITVKAANIMGQVTGAEEGNDILARVNNRSLRQLEKEDPSLLSEVKNNLKSHYVKMYNEQYGTNKMESDF